MGLEVSGAAAGAAGGVAVGSGAGIIIGITILIAAMIVASTKALQAARDLAFPKTYKVFRHYTDAYGAGKITESKWIRWSPDGDFKFGVYTVNPLEPIVRSDTTKDVPPDLLVTNCPPDPSTEAPEIARNLNMRLWDPNIGAWSPNAMNVEKGKNYVEFAVVRDNYFLITPHENSHYVLEYRFVVPFGININDGFSTKYVRTCP